MEKLWNEIRILNDDETWYINFQENQCLCKTNRLAYGAYYRNKYALEAVNKRSRKVSMAETESSLNEMK